MTPISIRRAEARDLPALLAIYNHYVVHTPVTFDIEPRTLDQHRQWFDGFGESGRHQCFVAVRDDVAVGWSSSGRFKPRAAYDTTVETSIYLAPDATGQGLGRRLYETLFAALADEDIHCLLAGATLPNPASVALHETLGFRRAGMYPQVGRKFGRYWDVVWYWRAMRQ